MIYLLEFYNQTKIIWHCGVKEIQRHAQSAPLSTTIVAARVLTVVAHWTYQRCTGVSNSREQRVHENMQLWPFVQIKIQYGHFDRV